ncbi:MAG TPA: hypothetical protein VF800_02450 [Telluria sp.]|jgi:hypothetical protein
MTRYGNSHIGTDDLPQPHQNEQLQKLQQLPTPTDEHDPLGTLLFEMTVVDDSTSPLQLVSAELLAYYRRCEAELIALKAAPAVAERAHGTTLMCAKRRAGQDDPGSRGWLAVS